MDNYLLYLTPLFQNITYDDHGHLLREILNAAREILDAVRQVKQMGVQFTAIPDSAYLCCSNNMRSRKREKTNFVISGRRTSNSRVGY